MNEKINEDDDNMNINIDDTIMETQTNGKFEDDEYVVSENINMKDFKVIKKLGEGSYASV